MAPTRFSYGEDGAVTSDDTTLNELLPGILTRGLLLDRIPSSLPLVGHCRVVQRWCIFARERGESEIHGVVLPEEQYAQAGFDPFVVAATHLKGRDVRDAVEHGPVDPPASGLAQESDEPLRAAYSCFLAGDNRLRRGPYLSVLPADLTARVSPLSCLTVAGPRIVNDAIPLPDTKPHTARESEPPSTPVSPLDETRGLPIEEIPWRPAQKSAPPGPEDDTEAPAAPDASWESVPLDRGGDSIAAARPPKPQPADPTDLDERLRTIEHRAASTRRILVAGLVIALLLGIVAGIVLETRIRRVASLSVPVTTIARGLGVEAPPREVEAAIEAHLRDLSTVAVQSGAWQAVLERRGVERDIFLDRLVDLSGRQKELLSLADKIRPLTTLAAKADSLDKLAPAADDLVGVSNSRDELVDLAKRREELISLADAVGALSSIAPVADSLLTIAGSADDLATLASNAENLNALAGDRHDLQAVADQSAALAALAANATALRTLADHGAELMVFWERYGGAVQTLARQQQSLSSLAERHRTLTRLVEEGPALSAMADNKALQTLADRPGDVENLVRLAQNADALLAQIDAPTESGDP
jgi:hypothetical protein